MDKFLIRTATKGKETVNSQNSSPSPIFVNDETRQKPSVSSAIRSGRVFQEKWTQMYSWLNYDSQLDKVFCRICKNAVDLKAPLPQNANVLRTMSTFVKDGFSSWNKSLERFKVHEKSDLHRAAALVCQSLQKGTNVHTVMSKSKSKEMIDSRTCLKKILSTIRYLAVQGLPLRGHIDENSNFIQLVKLRADDVPELKSWLARSKYKWMSHDIINEILSLLSLKVQTELRQTVKKRKYFSILADETSDISINEQMVVCLRTVDDNLDVEEHFLGLYETSFTDSETLYKIINDVLLRYSLGIEDCRGQCYDGASNVSGSISGLQKRILSDEPRALYVHCNAHNLNLVVQDSFQKISSIRDFLALIKDLINFVRDSPKRLSMFKSLQLQGLEESKNLRPFCPTRWCVRVKSLQSILKNYSTLLKFFHQIGEESTESGAKAHGFEEKMMAFKNYFLLRLLIFVFERIEILNSELQKKDLNFSAAQKKTECLRDSLKEIRENSYDTFWEDIQLQVRGLDIEDPILPRRRKIPKRLDDKPETHHTFNDPKSYFRQIYYEVVDMAISRLDDRKHKQLSEHLENMELFATGKTVSGDRILEFYQNDFDASRLVLHRNMFLDIATQKNETIESLTDVVRFLKANEEVRELLAEFTKFIRFVLVIPVTTCTAERSFSSLRRLKTYLRSTMTQKRLNDIMINHIHKEITESIDLNQVCDEFISRSITRMNTFALGSAETDN